VLGRIRTIESAAQDDSDANVLTHDDEVSQAVSGVRNPSIAGVSGTLSAGGTVTIHGGGFGTKTPVKPLIFAPFDSSMSPSSLGRRISWTAVSNFAHSTQGYTGNCAKATNDSGNWTLRADYNYWTAEGNRAYMHKKVKYNFTVQHGNATNNFKIWRCWPAGASGYPNIYAASNNGRVFTEQAQGCSHLETGFWDEFPIDTTNWFTQEILLKASSAVNKKDGWLSIRDDNTRHVAEGTVITRTSCSPAYMVANYVVHGVLANRGSWNPAWSVNNRMWVDDVYVDVGPYAWARVVLGDARTYGACRRLEIQIPTYWANGTITVRANPGRFASGQTVYLYVFDKDNRPNSAGFPVRVR
jgi:hypothetical protein